MCPLCPLCPRSRSLARSARPLPPLLRPHSLPVLIVLIQLFPPAASPPQEPSVNICTTIKKTRANTSRVGFYCRWLNDEIDLLANAEELAAEDICATQVIEQARERKAEQRARLGSAGSAGRPAAAASESNDIMPHTPQKKAAPPAVPLTKYNMQEAMEALYASAPRRRTSTRATAPCAGASPSSTACGRAISAPRSTPCQPDWRTQRRG